MNLKDNPKAYAIMGCAMRVHQTLGFGFLESAYGDALEIEFAKNGIPYVREDAVQIFYDGQPLKTTYRADFTCFDRNYIVELKAIKDITKIEWAQVIHYLRATKIPYAMLLNFGRPQFQYDTFDLDKLPSSSVIGADHINSDGCGSHAAFGYPPKQASAAHSRSTASHATTTTSVSPNQKCMERPWGENDLREAQTVLRSGSESPTDRSFTSGEENS